MNCKVVARTLCLDHQLPIGKQEDRFTKVEPFGAMRKASARSIGISVFHEFHVSLRIDVIQQPAAKGKPEAFGSSRMFARRKRRTAALRHRPFLPTAHHSPLTTSSPRRFPSESFFMFSACGREERKGYLCSLLSNFILPR